MQPLGFRRLGRSVMDNSLQRRDLALPLRFGFWGAVCSAAVITTVYSVTLNERLIESYLDAMPTYAVWGVAAWQMLISPALIWIGRPRPLPGSSRLQQVFFGLIVGLWANSTLLAIPYIGAYVNIPALLVGSFLSQGSNAGPSYYGSAIVTNLVIWPLLVWGLSTRRRVRIV